VDWVLSDVIEEIVISPYADESYEDLVRCAIGAKDPPRPPGAARTALCLRMRGIAASLTSSASSCGCSDNYYIRPELGDSFFGSWASAAKLAAIPAGASPADIGVQSMS
jgi:hypothetical protein